ncbi:MAG TPA: cation:proton antiporter [Burkholderiales bacterium]
MQKPLMVAGLGVALLLPAQAHAAASGDVAQGFLWLAVLLIAAKFGAMVERLRLPAVLGEILVGVLLGNLALIGITFLEPIGSDTVVGFLAQLGAVILLFQLGLESNVQSMRKVGARAFAVATIGVAAPFVLGTYIVGPLLMPGLSSSAYLFLGAALTATSVGITGRVFRDMGCLSRPEAQIVLGAAVIDDVLGLVILSIVSSIAARGAISAGEVAWISAQAVGFLAAALALGQWIAPPLSRLFARIDSSDGTKLAFALGLCLLFAYLAHVIGLAPIVGAFAAGLILDEVHFKHYDRPAINGEMLEAVSAADAQVKAKTRKVLERYNSRHLEHMLEPIGHLLVPVFFVLAGMQVKLDVFLDPKLVVVALALTLVAIAGKLVCGLVAGPRTNRWLIGWGMVPRGEVGLIFAFVGKSLGVVSDGMFSVIVIMVMLTTIVTPPALSYLLRARGRSVSQQPTSRHSEVAP